MKENGERKLWGNCLPLTVLPKSGDFSSVQTEADICSKSREITKETKFGSYYKG